MTLEELVRLLRARGGFELVNHQASPNQLRMLGRVRKPAAGQWLLVVHQLVMAQATWSIDVSRHYFPKGGKLVYAWRLILQADNIVEHYHHVAQTITNAPRARATVEEQALPGARINRNAPSLANRGKGAQSSLKATVGPFALAALHQQSS